jgi:hypothetical protein
MCSQIIASIGLAFDMVGAVLVAIEVVRVYRGPIAGTIENTWEESGQPTFEFQRFEKKKRQIMGTGLGFLLFGFLLQIIALWI